MKIKLSIPVSLKINITIDKSLLLSLVIVEVKVLLIDNNDVLNIDSKDSTIHIINMSSSSSIGNILSSSPNVIIKSLENVPLWVDIPINFIWSYNHHWSVIEWIAT